MRPFINRIRCHARLFALAFLSLLASVVVSGCSASDPAWKAALVALAVLGDATGSHAVSLFSAAGASSLPLVDHLAERIIA